MTIRVAIKNFFRLLGFGVVLFSATPNVVAQCSLADRKEAAVRADTKVSQEGNAEVASAPIWVIDSYAYRCQHPNVYWHGKDWKIDLLLPTGDNDSYAIRIHSGHRHDKLVKLDYSYFQIASISLASNNEAIVIGYVYGNWSGLFSVASIINLENGDLIDSVVASSFSISPNRRFLIFLNGDQTYPFYDYRLYDILRTPRENTCGYRQNDPEHKDLDEEDRGTPLFPKKADQVGCSEADQQPFESENHALVSNYLWSADSREVIFADSKNETTLSVILVKMPAGPKDMPSTSTYQPKPSAFRWSASTNSDEPPIHLSWNAELGKAVSISSGGLNAMNLQLSKFTPID